MSSSWGKKLEKKLTGLADTASKESIQTLSNWIAFNRKHAPTIATVLTNALQDSKNKAKRQWLYWQLIHEVLIREKGNASKWDKLSELRLALGEALQPAMKILGSAMPGDQLEACLEEWGDQDVFGGPSLLSQIRRLYQNRNNQSTAAVADIATKTTSETSAKAAAILNDNAIAIATVNNTTKPTESSAPASDSSAQAMTETSQLSNEKTTAVAVAAAVAAAVETTTTQAIVGDASEVDQKEQTTTIDTTGDDDNDALLSTTPFPDNNDDDDDDAAGETKEQQQEQETQDNSGTNAARELPAKSPSPQKRTSLSNLNQQVEYDFESKGVPSGEVESREFLDPCKAITTLQIARDVRTNTAVEISTALANLPADILTACQDLDSGKLQELDTAMTNEFSIRIPSSLIDLDIDEETSSLNMFQDIVQRQQKAREKLIYLLLKSRCRFGSMEAARDFYEIDNLAEKLKKRKELLSDALELEGLDTNQINDNDNDIDIDNNKTSQNKKRDHEEELPPLTWYKPDNNEDDKAAEGKTASIESTIKKQKIV